MQPSDAAVEHSKGVVEAPGPVVEEAGFTFVEEDDVAFTLQLCREVHRLYGDYQEGGLPSDDYVVAGLTVTMEMLALLSGRVTDGMPAMRITVAAAQTREMLAVMFGRDPLEGPLDGRYRAHYRAIVDESARALVSRPSPLPPGWAQAALGRSQNTGAAGAAAPPESPPQPDRPATDPVRPTDTLPTDEVPVEAPQTATTDPNRHTERSRRSVLRRLFSRRAK